MWQTDSDANQIPQVAAGPTSSGHPAIPRKRTGLPSTAEEILDAIDVPIVVLERNFTIASFNRPAAETLGLAVSDIGRPARDVAGFADLRNLERWCAQVVSIETTSRHDFRKRTRRSYCGSPRTRRATTGRTAQFSRS